MMLTRLTTVMFLSVMAINAEASLLDRFGRLFGWTPCQTLARTDELLATENNVQIGRLAPEHLTGAFAEPVWRGELKNRVAMLQAKYPDRIKWVHNVGHKFTNRDESFTAGQRDVLVISTRGLSREQHTQLTKDYIAAVSEGTLSHPLSERAGHLYTRVGSKMYDFMGSGLREQTMSDLTSEKLEPVIVLKEAEFGNLLNYISKAKSSNDVLGGFGYEGAKGETASRPEDNRPTDPKEKHNCTSWLGLAPVGPTGGALCSIAGAPRGYDVYRNPGWWSQFLASRAPKEIVPFVVHWTPKSLNEARPVEGQNLDWNFGLH